MQKVTIIPTQAGPLKQIQAEINMLNKLRDTSIAWHSSLKSSHDYDIQHVHGYLSSKAYVEKYKLIKIMKDTIDVYEEEIKELEDQKLKLLETKK